MHSELQKRILARRTLSSVVFLNIVNYENAFEFRGCLQVCLTLATVLLATVSCRRFLVDKRDFLRH